MSIAVGAPVATAALVASVLLRRPLMSRATTKSIDRHRTGLDTLSRVATRRRLARR